MEEAQHTRHGQLTHTEQLGKRASKESESANKYRTLVVADVTYVYPSPFNITMPFYTSPATMTFQRAFFNTPRNVPSITYSGSRATICP